MVWNNDYMTCAFCGKSYPYTRTFFYDLTYAQCRFCLRSELEKSFWFRLKRKWLYRRCKKDFAKLPLKYRELFEAIGYSPSDIFKLTKNK